MKYNELTRSINLDLNVSDFVAATPLTTGLITGTVTFQDGNSAPLTGGGTHTITSYTANNGIATGSLRVAASQDAEDTLTLAGASDKLYLLAEAGTTDNQITVKVGSGAALNSLVLTGFEFVTDSVSNDLYNLGNLAAVAAGLTFTDNASNDHDTLKVADDAAGNAGTINLATQNATYGIDFDVLDVVSEASTGLNLVGVAAGEGTDEVVVGALSQIASIDEFESLVLTSVTGGSTFVLNTTANTVTQGVTTVASNEVRALSAGGLVFEGELGNSYLPSIATAVSLTATGAGDVTLVGGSANDTLTAAAGDDTLVGGVGADTMDGGVQVATAEVHKLVLTGTVLAGGAGNFALTFGDTTTAVINEGGEIPTGADVDQIGAAIAAFDWSTTTFDVDGAGAAPLVTGANLFSSVTYDAVSNTVSFTYKTTAGDVDDNALAATLTTADGAGNVTINTVASNAAAPAAITETVVGFGPQVDSADTYIIGDGESGNTVATADTILNWDVTDILALGWGGHAANYSEAAGAVADFAAAQTAATTAIAALNTTDAGNVQPEFYNFQWTATTGYLFEDTDGNGTIDQFVQLTGVDGTEISAANLRGRLEGTQGDDTLTGTAGDDVINGYAGNDTIVGAAGADIITGGAGIDNITTDAGADVVSFSGVALAANRDLVTDFTVGTDILGLDVDYTTAATAAGNVAVVEDEAGAAANVNGAAYNLGALTAGNTNALDLVTLDTATLANTANANLANATDGTELLKALVTAGAGNTASGIQMDNVGDSLYIAVDNGTNGYLYIAASGADNLAGATEITLVGTFSSGLIDGVAAGQTLMVG